MTAYKIAAIGGDGIGPGVLASGIQCLHTVAARHDIRFDVTDLDWGSARYLGSRGYTSDDWRDVLCRHDAAYFGAVGSREVEDHISLRQLRIKICVGLNLEVCTRPVWKIRGVESCLVPEKVSNLDLFFVRQNVNGEYSGEGDVVETVDDVVARDIAVYSRASIERIARYAFRLAMDRGKRLAFGTKSNAMQHGMVLWDQTITRIATEFPEVRYERVLSDALLYRMLQAPGTLDVILGTNLHLDLLTDAAAAMMGSLGLAPSGNIDPERKNPPMFEPTHGSAFDLVGTHKANPVGTILSGVLLLRYLGEAEAANHLQSVVEQVTERGVRTPDVGGEATTQQVTDAICEQIAGG